jgi:hypothetical protein
LPDSPIELTEYSTLSCPENFPTKGGALFNGFDLQTEGKLIEILWAANRFGSLRGHLWTEKLRLQSERSECAHCGHPEVGSQWLGVQL